MSDAILVIITWLGAVAPFMQELPAKDMQVCDKRMMAINEVFVAAREANPEFAFILECKKNETD